LSEQGEDPEMDWYQITAIALSTFAVGSLLGHAAGYAKGVSIRARAWEEGRLMGGRSPFFQTPNPYKKEKK
jgi:hypothetical protein